MISSDAKVATATSSHARSVVIVRLAGLAPLDEDAIQLLSDLGGVQNHRAGSELVGERQPQVLTRFLTKGWAAQVKSLPDGRRQILGFIVPGDAVGPCLRPHPLAFGATMALTPAETVDARSVLAACQTGASKTLGDALHVSASVHEAYLLNQIMRLGRLTAYERICHLFLELRDRLKLAGLAADSRFPMPLTQEILADVNGLSTVHVNRVLQQLRRDAMLEVRGGYAVLLDAEAMASACDYVPPEAARWL